MNQCEVCGATKADKHQKWSKDGKKVLEVHRFCRAHHAEVHATHDELLARIHELEAERDRALSLGEGAVRGATIIATYRAEAEATVERLKEAWESLRHSMEVTRDAGIDIYVRRNAEDFLKMMERAGQIAEMEK